jgi:hypothetical protein
MSDGRVRTGPGHMSNQQPIRQPMGTLGHCEVRPFALAGSMLSATHRYGTDPARTSGPHPDPKSTVSGHAAVSGRSPDPGELAPRPLQRPGRVGQHPHPPAHPDRLRLQVSRGAHRTGHAQRRRAVSTASRTGPTNPRMKHKSRFSSGNGRRRRAAPTLIRHIRGMRSCRSSEGRPAHGWRRSDRGCPLGTGLVRLMWHANGTTDEGKGPRSLGVGSSPAAR